MYSGLLQLQDKDVDYLNKGTPDNHGVKVVMGPGTGHGQGFLVKSKFSKCYEVFPSEGGHVEFSPRSDLDMRLVHHAYKFIETSDNVENKRAKAKIDRISHERLGAGPAIPLIYDFFKQENPNLERILESGPNKKAADDISSHDVINAFNEKNDPLCRMVVEKFSEIFAVQAGDTALKLMPSGGLYLIGGVTNGIRNHMMQDKAWMDIFNAKGRLSHVMHRTPVMIVKSDVELGILGAEEVAYRLSGSFSKDELMEHF